MNIRYIICFFSMLVSVFFTFDSFAESTRKERRLINEGNSLYNERKFIEAQSIYEEALQENPASAEARYNLGLSQVKQVVNPADTAGKSRSLIESARKNFTEVASLVKTKPGLAAKANFNMGNIEFNSKDFRKAIEYYKQALRIDPSDEKARKNLRIAQKNLQNQNQNQDKNKDQQNKENKDQEENKDQQQNNKNNNQDKEQEKEKQQDNSLSNQAASRILQAIDNKESATRARVNKASKGEKSESASGNMRRW